MNYTKGNMGALGIWEASGNGEIIGIKDMATSAPICYIKPANWEIAHLIASAPKLYEALRAVQPLITTEWNGSIQEMVRQALAKAEGK